jgi:hypothetical protein
VFGTGASLLFLEEHVDEEVVPILVVEEDEQAPVKQPGPLLQLAQGSGEGLRKRQNILKDTELLTRCRKSVIGPTCTRLARAETHTYMQYSWFSQCETSVPSSCLLFLWQKELQLDSARPS